ncbi:hypothetical protein AC249_AIPGENE22605 [Exaiptasia diaphana]|nr:hypothetical protein AC249_AIPGENE22605 [Exaiptasia diaphana]
MASYEDLKGQFTLKMKTGKLKKTFGRAKLFEIRRIVRRIKQLSLKKGTAQQLDKNKRKIDRLEKQLEFLKDTNFEAFKTSLDTEDELKDSNMATEGDSDVKSLVMSKLLEIIRKSEKSHQLEIKQKNTRKSPDPYKENDAQVAILQDDSQLIENKEIELKNEFFDTNSQDLGHSSAVVVQ